MKLLREISTIVWSKRNMENKNLITMEQSKMIIESMPKKYSKFKKFNNNHWKEGKLLCFRFTSSRLPNGFQDVIGECVFNNNGGTRDNLMPIYSWYVYFAEIQEEYCVTLLENAKWEFKEVPTEIQVNKKYNSLIDELKSKGKAKLIEATEISIKLKLLKNKTK
jgi:hypothetical protein